MMHNSDFAGSHINLDKKFSNLYEILILTTFTFLSMDKDNRLHMELFNQNKKINIFSSFEAFMSKNATKMSIEAIYSLLSIWCSVFSFHLKTEQSSNNNMSDKLLFNVLKLSNKNYDLRET